MQTDVQDGELEIGDGLDSPPPIAMRRMEGWLGEWMGGWMGGWMEAGWEMGGWMREATNQ